VVVVVLLGMTYRYIFLLLETAREMSEAREVRQVGTLEARDARRLAAATAGVLLARTLAVSGEVHTAMQARGFRGEVYLLEDLRMQWRDWLQCGAFATVAGAAIWFGR
jgi:energy-coupling factor transporter transmembrane protein EcfT